MTDLVRDLRICYEQEHDELHRKAADEIERLRGLAPHLRQAALIDDWHTFDSLLRELAGTASQPKAVHGGRPMTLREVMDAEDGSTDNQPSPAQDDLSDVELDHLPLCRYWDGGACNCPRTADNQSEAP